MTLVAVALSLLLAAKMPAPTAPQGRKASEWDSYNKARAQAGLLPRKASRGATRVSPALVTELPSSAAALDAAPGVTVLPAAPAPAATTPVVTRLAEASEPRREPEPVAHAGERTEARPPSPAQAVVANALRNAAAMRAAERARVAAVMEPPEHHPAADGVARTETAIPNANPNANPPSVPVDRVPFPVAPGPSPAAATPNATATATATPTATSAHPERSVREADAESKGGPPHLVTAVSLDALGGAIRAGADGLHVDVRLVAHMGGLTLAVERPAIALR